MKMTFFGFHEVNWVHLIGEMQDVRVTFSRDLSLDLTYQKSLKSVSCWQCYPQSKKGGRVFFGTHSVYLHVLCTCRLDITLVMSFRFTGGTMFSTRQQRTSQSLTLRSDLCCCGCPAFAVTLFCQYVYVFGHIMSSCLFRECRSRGRFLLYDCVIVCFVE